MGFPVECALCGREVDAGDMRGHENRYHWDHVFRCSACAKHFDCSQDLRRHSRSTGHAIPVAFRLPAEEFLDDVARELVAQERLEEPEGDFLPAAGEWTCEGGGSGEPREVAPGQEDQAAAQYAPQSGLESAGAARG